MAQTLDTWEDGALLDGGRTLKTVSIDTTEKVLAELHFVEALDNGIPVGLNDTIGVH